MITKKERALRVEIVDLHYHLIGASAAFDRKAQFFYQDTGMMAPGKDDCMGTHSYEDRVDAWRKWLLEQAP